MSLQNRQGLPTYGFKMFPEESSIPGGLKTIAFITYRMNHPTFPNSLIATGPDRGFAASYDGEGCLTRVVALIRSGQSRLGREPLRLNVNWVDTCVADLPEYLGLMPVLIVKPSRRKEPIICRVIWDVPSSVPLQAHVDSYAQVTVAAPRDWQDLQTRTIGEPTRLPAIALVVGSETCGAADTACDSIVFWQMRTHFLVLEEHLDSTDSAREHFKRECVYRLLKGASEVISLGTGGARIGLVNSERVEYIDNSGRERAIDLQARARTWARLSDQQRCFVPLPSAVTERSYALNRYVGLRGHWWVAFMENPITLFEFPTQGEWRDFRVSLAKAGWHLRASQATGEKERCCLDCSAP